MAAARKRTTARDAEPDNAPDRRALRALFGTYWTASGWRDSDNTTNPPLPSDEEVAYARQVGYMFEPRSLTHDQAVAWLLRARASVSRKEATDAFVASLSTRRLEWRSALGSYAVARHFPDHPHDGSARAHSCGTCGYLGGPTADGPEDLSILNFERFKWGGVRHLDPVYVALDLELFALGERPAPGPEDFALLTQVLQAARDLGADGRLDHLQREVGRHLDSSKPEREVLIQILGYCGVLQDPDDAGFLHDFVECRARHGRGHGDWTYPVENWRGRHGVNEEAVAFWFGAYQEGRR